MNKKAAQRKRRKLHISRSIRGTHDRPRLVVFRSNKHIYAQLIDDTVGVTIASANDKSMKKGSAKQLAGQVGEKLGELAKETGVKEVVFDRNGYKYHGRVAALADGARKAGLKF